MIHHLTNLEHSRLLPKEVEWLGKVVRGDELVVTRDWNSMGAPIPLVSLERFEQEMKPLLEQDGSLVQLKAGERLVFDRRHILRGENLRIFIAVLKDNVERYVTMSVESFNEVFRVL